MKINKLFHVTIIMLLLATSSVCAQKIFVKGKVVDKTNLGMVGVTVNEKGTSNNAITDADGNFSIHAAGNGNLIFSYVGFKPHTVKIDGKTTMTVTLEEDQKFISDVVVVGYATQKKVAVTGAVASVKSTELLTSTASTLGSALAGKISGLTAIQGNGQPGADNATMYLRGMSTFNGSSPLILVDGVPRDELRVIDPNEVESISVLKDASATAVFGVRGANGVIIITTKRGKAGGKPEMNASVVQSFSDFTRRPTRVTSLEYMKLRNEAYKNDGYSDEDLPYSDEVIEKFKNPLLGLDPADPNYEQEKKVREYLYCNHDYYGEFTKIAPQTRVNLNINGGTDKLRYFINGNYLHQGSNFVQQSPSELGFDPTYRINRYGFRSNFDSQLTKSFRAFLNVGSYVEVMGMPSCPEYLPDWQTAVKHTMWVLSGFPALTPGPTTIAGFGVPAGETVNPATLGVSAYELLGKMGFREMTSSALNTTLGFDWKLDKLLPGLSHKAQVSFDYFDNVTTQGEQYLPMYDIKMDYDNNTLSYANRRSTTIYLTMYKGASTSYKANFQYSINYNHTFGEKHTVGAMILAQRDNWEGYSADLPYNILGVAGRATYDYDHRYMAEFDMGYNGSEQFSPKKRFGFFPAISGAWVISNEPFMKDVDAVTSLKLRGSVGEVGNDQLGSSRFLYLSDITVSGGGLLSSLSQGKTVNEGLLGNENLTWETALKQNYGLDLQLWGALTMTLDAFKEHRTGILLQRGMVPTIQGVPLEDIPKTNLGIVDNHGFEIELGYNKRLTDDWSISFKSNYGYSKNKVVYYDEAKYADDYAYRYRVTGYSIDQQWGIPIDYSNGNGFFNSQEELDKYLSNITYEVGTPRVGDFIYKDVNKDGKINDKDKVPIGYSPVPRVTYGLNLSTKYKNFDANIFFQGVGMCSNYYSGVYVWETSFLGTYFDYHEHAWTAERYAAGEKITYPALSTHSTSNHIANSFFIMDKSYCRLRNLELGYTTTQLKKIGLKNVRFSLNGQNLLTFTKFKMKHIDPELSHQLDYPINRSVSGGISINF